MQAFDKTKEVKTNIYAFGLLEALCRVNMPFIFKGGTSLMLLLGQPRRLSTDIDIIVAHQYMRILNLVD